MKPATLTLSGWFTVECATGVIGTCCLRRCWACWYSTVRCSRSVTCLACLTRLSYCGSHHCE
ncbi:hypothetical protein D3C79_772110 [compost metagenome]